MTDTLLSRARAAWESGATLRSRRQRYKRYTFGRQWLDPCLLDNYTVRTERQYLIDNGYTPVTNNIIRQLVKTITGCFRESVADDPKLAHTLSIDALTFQEFLISGCAIQHLGAWTPRMVGLSRFFIDRLTESDGRGAELVGELHDMTLAELVERFAHGEGKRMAMLRTIYRRQAADLSAEAQLPRLGESADENLSFDSADRSGTVRVFEVWRRECQRMPNGRGRVRIDTRWVCRFMTTDGQVLDTLVADTHPYALCFYPMIDGEVHSFVEDVIDQQHNINWLMTLNDRLLSQAAKGVVMFPENQFSSQMPAAMVAEKLREPDGIVVYRPEPGVPGPQQVITSVNTLGTQQMLDTQLRLMREVSGVGDALRGQQTGSFTSASLYRSQQEGQLLALRDLLDTFHEYLRRRSSRLIIPNNN